MAKTQLIKQEDQVTVDEFLACCKQCGSRPKKVHKGVIYLYGTVFLGNLYLDKYKIDIFNCHFPLMVIDTDENTIRIWGCYGPKIEVNGEYKYDFKVIQPTYTIEGLLSPEN